MKKENNEKKENRKVTKITVNGPDHFIHCHEDPFVFIQIELYFGENNTICYDTYDYMKYSVGCNSASWNTQSKSVSNQIVIPKIKVVYVIVYQEFLVHFLWDERTARVTHRSATFRAAFMSAYTRCQTILVPPNTGISSLSQRVLILSFYENS